VAVLTALPNRDTWGTSRRSKLATHERASLEAEKLGALASISSSFTECEPRWSFLKEALRLVLSDQGRQHARFRAGAIHCFVTLDGGGAAIGGGARAKP
jgi:hypothetical protein